MHACIKDRSRYHTVIIYISLNKYREYIASFIYLFIYSLLTTKTHGVYRHR